jgi:hypothetical protein
MCRRNDTNVALKSRFPIKPYFDNDPDNLGAKLEADVYMQTLSLDMNNMFESVLHEKDLISLFGWESSSIDQLIIMGDYMIPIQLKWRRTRRRETQGIENFIKSIKYIKQVLDKDVLFGIWSSRMIPFDDNTQWLHDEKIVCVSYFEDIDGLVDRTIHKLVEKLNDAKVVLDGIEYGR